MLSLFRLLRMPSMERKRELRRSQTSVSQPKQHGLVIWSDVDIKMLEKNDTQLEFDTLQGHDEFLSPVHKSQPSPLHSTQPTPPPGPDQVDLHINHGSTPKSPNEVTYVSGGLEEESEFSTDDVCHEEAPDNFAWGARHQFGHSQTVRALEYPMFPRRCHSVSVLEKEVLDGLVWDADESQTRLTRKASIGMLPFA
eukprot:c45981_g1_i1.p1 GENE.c45981_g1_i1~~c45981_g1_i1.p1  ORF type:complete len:196 (-),score=21.39 c45981_g1_i1:92-679(-)